MFEKLTNYLKEAMIELKKVVWPTRKQTINYSIVVIAMSIGVAIFFGILDYFFRNGLTFIVG